MTSWWLVSRRSQSIRVPAHFLVRDGSAQGARDPAPLVLAGPSRRAGGKLVDALGGDAEELGHLVGAGVLQGTSQPYPWTRSGTGCSSRTTTASIRLCGSTPITTRELV